MMSDDRIAQIENRLSKITQGRWVAHWGNQVLGITTNTVSEKLKEWRLHRNEDGRVSVEDVGIAGLSAERAPLSKLPGAAIEQFEEIEANAAFICAAADDIRFLLDEVKRLADFKATLENMTIGTEIARIRDEEDKFHLAIGHGDWLHKTLDEVAQTIIKEGDSWG